MKILFIGGTGNISSACVALALRRGYEVTLLNRGIRPASAPFPAPVKTIQGDRNDVALLREVAEGGGFDVVANFVGYKPEQIEGDIRAFAGQVAQYVFISSASAYQKPLNHYVITESTPLANPFWQYSRDKIACEEVLIAAYRSETLPITIVRPSYTYGETWIPSAIGGQGYTVVDRMRTGRPIISHGDGQSLWVMTHNTDFALGFVGLFGKSAAIGEAFHITSDEALTWDQLYIQMGRAAGCQPELVHISSEFIAGLYPEMRGGLYGDKACSVVFDNSKVKRVVPEFHARVGWAEGVARSIAWFDEDPDARHTVDDGANEMIDRLIAAHRAALTPA